MVRFRYLPIQVRTRSRCRAVVELRHHLSSWLDALWLNRPPESGDEPDEGRLGFVDSRCPHTWAAFNACVTLFERKDSTGGEKAVSTSVGLLSHHPLRRGTGFETRPRGDRY
jgi:hypothetical protein